MSALRLLHNTIPNPESLFRQVTERLAIAIVSGAIQQGGLIPNEDDLKAEFSVSRTAYREAVKFLSAKGLIDAKPRAGTRANPPSHWNLLDPDVLRWSLSASANEKFIHDLYELRSFIEPNAAYIAAERRIPEHLDRLKDALAGMEREPPYTEANMRHDLAFHEALIDAGGNQALACLKSVVSTTLLWALQLQSKKLTTDFQTALRDHQRVYEAIAHGRADLAKALTKALVIDALHDTLDSFRRRDAQNLARQAAE
jgi:GntR family transcriptional regulator, galactonate operon transcriptional repressor